MLWNAQHVGAGATLGQSYFPTDDEVGAEEEKVTHTYQHINKVQKMVDKIINL